MEGRRRSILPLDVLRVGPGEGSTSSEPPPQHSPCTTSLERSRASTSRTNFTAVVEGEGGARGSSNLVEGGCGPGASRSECERRNRRSTWTTRSVHAWRMREMKMRGWRSSACMRRSKFQLSSLGRIYLPELVPYVLGMRRIPSDPREKPWLRPCGREKKKTPRWREGGREGEKWKKSKNRKSWTFSP